MCLASTVSRLKTNSAASTGTWDYVVQHGETDFSTALACSNRKVRTSSSSTAAAATSSCWETTSAATARCPTDLPPFPTMRGDRAALHDEDFVDTWTYAEASQAETSLQTTTISKPKAILDTKQSQPAGHTEATGRCTTGRAATPRLLAMVKTTPHCALSSKRLNAK